MNPAILAIILKGISVATTLWENRELALKALNAIQNIVTRRDPTQAEIDAIEADLDGMLEEFNSPLPPAT